MAQIFEMLMILFIAGVLVGIAVRVVRAMRAQNSPEGARAREASAIAALSRTASPVSRAEEIVAAESLTLREHPVRRADLATGDYSASAP